MACFRPLTAWQLDDGTVVFVERGAVRRELKLPCGQCVGCRLERSRQWAVRCMHESQMHEYSCFVTLTYDDAHFRPSLHYPDFQKFMKRLRRKFHKPVRFYMCGEYGEQFSRPHFHACLFGAFFADRVVWKKLDSGSILYRSALLESLWPFGFSSVGDVTFESAAYVARYVMKKVTGNNADLHYNRVDMRTGEEIQLVPEFNRMSLKPGIGADWFRKYMPEVLVRDGVVVNGRVCRTPRYYDNMLANVDEYKLDDLKMERLSKALQYASEQTIERLAVREVVASAMLNNKKRTL